MTEVTEMTVTRAAPARLQAGAHSTPDDGMCLMEAVAWVAGEQHTDAPACTSPVLAAFARGWNDGLRSDDEREQLRHYIPLLIGTAGDHEADELRAWMALDWLIRVHLPAWLDASGCAWRRTLEADRLRELAPITDAATLTASAAARDAASAAASAAARDAATLAASAAARDAASAAANHGRGHAHCECRCEGRCECRCECRCEGRGHARCAAGWAATSAAATAAASAAARDAGWAAASAALAPTMDALQRSAHDLMSRMIAAR